MPRVTFSREVWPSMALELEPQDAQKRQAPITPGNLYKLMTDGPTWAVRLDGKLVALGGHTPVWPGRTILWGALGRDCGPALLPMTREVKRQVEAMALEFDRIEAYAERHHAEGNAWLRLLGLRREGLMRKFAHGHDYVLYAKVT